MKINLIKLLPSILFAVSGIAGDCAVAQAVEPAPVTINVDTINHGAAISRNFIGLSFEVSQLLLNDNGVHYFRPDNKPLIDLFHTLGIKSLRIGGNTSDRDVKKLPEQADLDSLFGFAQAANVKVIYCLRLHNGDPQVDIQTVKYIMAHYSDQMDAFSIGQEPSAYPVEKIDTRPNSERMGDAAEKYQYSSYAAEWKKFADAIIAAVPEVKFCGPSVHNNGEWAVKFMRDFGHSNNVVLVTEHLYPGGAGGKVPTPEIGRERMLSNDSAMTNGFPKVYQKLYDSFVPVAISNGLPYRLEEVNNYFNGGATNVSNTFAAALWGLDFCYWWAAHNAAGLNFHTGDKVAAGNILRASKYTAFFSTTNGFLVRPLGYGIKAFDLGSHGNFLPVTITNSGNLNLNIYAVLGEDRNLYVTIINKEFGAKARDIDATINVGAIYPVGAFKAIPAPLYGKGQVVFLASPQGDIANVNDVTLGGGKIGNNGAWSGAWTPLETPSIKNLENGIFSVKVPAVTAAIVKLSPN